MIADRHGVIEQGPGSKKRLYRFGIKVAGDLLQSVVWHKFPAQHKGLRLKKPNKQTKKIWPNIAAGKLVAESLTSIF